MKPKITVSFTPDYIVLEINYPAKMTTVVEVGTEQRKLERQAPRAETIVVPRGDGCEQKLAQTILDLEKSV